MWGTGGGGGEHGKSAVCVGGGGGVGGVGVGAPGVGGWGGIFMHKGGQGGTGSLGRLTAWWGERGGGKGDDAGGQRVGEGGCGGRGAGSKS